MRLLPLNRAQPLPRGNWLELPEPLNCLSKRLGSSEAEGLRPDPLPAVLHYYAVVKPWLSAVEPYPAYGLWHLLARRCAGLTPFTHLNRLLLRQPLAQSLQRCLDPASARELRALEALLPPEVR